MKRKIAVVLIFVFGLFMILPSAGHSWYRGYPHHHYGHGHYYGYGWVPAAIIAGTLLTSAIIIGATNQNARSYQQPPIYVNPGPTVYYNPPPGQPYAAPDPDFVARYGNKPNGEWVTIPGQWVGETWVPQHKVFVSTNP